jgi:hypothetical protein
VRIEIGLFPVDAMPDHCALFFASKIRCAFWLIAIAPSIGVACCQLLKMLNSVMKCAFSTSD